MGTNVKTYLTYFVYYPILTIVCLEVALLLMGYRAYLHTNFSLEAVPSNAFIGHPELGIQLNPGDYEITINDSLSFSAIHIGPTERAMPSQSTEKPQIVMLGCSYTYGLGVDNTAHFTARVQTAFPNVHFFQRAVVGHGTIQSLLELKKLINQKPITTAILNLSSYHLMRNTLSPTYRAHLKIGYNLSNKQVDNFMHSARFPFKNSCDAPIEYVRWNQIYEHWAGREWFATINWLQTTYDRWQEDEQNQIDVTACLIQEMKDLCDANGIQFIVASLDHNDSIKKLKNQISEINWIDVGFDFSDPQLTNYPYDGHPSTVGHEYIAEKIRTYLKDNAYVE